MFPVVSKCHFTMVLFESETKQGPYITFGCLFNGEQSFLLLPPAIDFLIRPPFQDKLVAKYSIR